MAKASPKILRSSPNVGAKSLVAPQDHQVAASETASCVANISPSDNNNISSSPSIPSGYWNERNGQGRKTRNKTEEGGGGAARLARLPQQVKHRLVELFATFHTHARAKEIIEAEFGLKLTNNQLSVYDPTRANCGISKRLREYYDDIRKAYVEGAADIAITHQAHRLRRLEAVHDAAMKAKDFSNAINALKVAAQELGQLDSTVRVQHSGTVGHVHATVAEARSEVAMRLASLIERSQLQLPSSAAPAPDGAAGGGDSSGQVIDIIEDNED